MLPYKFPLSSGNVTRFFVVLILLLLLTTVFMVNSAINTWLTVRRYAMADIAHAMQKRIDTYRFVTWQIYEKLATRPDRTAANTLQETRLRPDIYYLEKTRRKTETLIFGAHDHNTPDIALRIASYLDTLWGPENRTWSMYFLNGQDNSLMLVSTRPLKDMTTRYKESTISNLITGRRAEMLQQANTLDERESFSLLRHSIWQNEYYFTLRTTFNQPGHLATVVAFDLPVNDLIPSDMSLENFRLEQDTTSVNSVDNPAKDDDTSSIRVAFSKPNVEFRVLLASTPLQLVYQRSITRMILDVLCNLLWPLLAHFALLLLALAGLFLLRQPSLRPDKNQSTELNALRILNEEIVTSLPVGLLVYDFSRNRTLISNKIAEHLLPHLNLQKIINMSDQHQGRLQATINNEVYEIRHVRSVLSPQTQLFLMRDQDRELLVKRKLQRARQVLEKNHQTRQQLLQNLGHALQKPLHQVIARLQSLPAESGEAIPEALESSQALSRLVDDIVLLNRLESHDWTPDVSPFNLQSLLDELTLAVLPAMQRKGLHLLVDNHLPGDEIRIGDQQAITRILSILMHYAITTTTWGKITLQIAAPEEQPEQLTMHIIDTGSGLNRDEISNSDFPFLSATSRDRFGETSGMAFFLCHQLCKQLGGHLEIQTHTEIGTRYNIQLYAPPEPHQEQEDKLLAGITALIEITVDDIRHIVVRQLEHWGANCITAEEHFSGQHHNVLLTDDPANMTEWSLLLADDEPGFHLLVPRQFRVNFNISSAIQEALLQLIEQQLSAEEVTAQEESEFIASGYFQLFADTVPDDVRRLYNEAANKDYSSLAQTAHRLKGAFAMLNLVPGKQLCEMLEQHIKTYNDSNIKNTTGNIDRYVKGLLQQGNQ